MVVIGDEILSGRTRDANAHHLAGVLSEIGVRLVEIRVISDAPDAIVAAVSALRGRVDYLFTSGGIGPTHDDLTADAVAEAFGVDIGVRADAQAILTAYYGANDLNEARLRMARIPDGAVLIDNPISRAPGFQLGNVFVLAGVPAIFQEMLAGLLDRLQGGPKTLSHAFRAAVPEGDVAAGLRELDTRHPLVSVGVYPFFRGGLGCTIVARSNDPQALSAAAAELRVMLGLHGVADIQETPPS